MKAFLFPLAVLASSAAAQTTSECGAAYIVDACLASEHAKLDACGNQDYDCKCNNWINILTCFNNCPNDTRKHESDGQRQIFCDYASRFASTSTQAVAPTQTSAPAQTTENAEAAEPTDAESSATTSSTAPASTNNAADLVLNAGGMLAAVAGVVAAVL
ncbi:hypothetical protein VTJ83DRAFT_7441 [Remersonia thermophila]|uniref:GPI anchored serine-threonine rich protein n=1 Tax=Remersonia thermophila TaxID=72144 RepID=A0ABR4D3H4_9PEZI